MPIALEDLDGLFDDPLMINLCEVTIVTIATDIIDINPTTPQGADRMAWAQNALNNPANAALPVWKFMVSNNMSAEPADITRTIPPASTPTDATITNECRKAIDSLYPVGV